MQPGDHVKVTFDIDDRCNSTPVTLVSYKSPSATYSATTVDQRIRLLLRFGKARAAGELAESTFRPVTTRPCSPMATSIWKESSTNKYDLTKVSGKDGGNTACSGMPGTGKFIDQRRLFLRRNRDLLDTWRHVW